MQAKVTEQAISHEEAYILRPERIYEKKDTHARALMAIGITGEKKLTVASTAGNLFSPDV